MSEQQSKNTSAEKSPASPFSATQGEVTTSTTPTTPSAVHSTPDDKSTMEANSTPPKLKVKTFLYRYVYQSAKAAQGYVIKNIPLIVPSVVLMLLGFKQWPESVPLLNFAREHRVASPIIGAIFVLLFVAAMIIPLFPAPESNKQNDGGQNKQGWPVRPWVITTAISSTSFVLSSILLLIVLIRPVWCPNTLCFTPAPAALIYGPHDANLEVNFTALQSSAYVLTKDPAQYSLSSKNIPTSSDRTSAGAVLMDTQKASSPYSIALTVHNLRSQGYLMIIEEVAIVVKQTPSIPSTLNILAQPPSLVYQSNNLYSVDYKGQHSNAIIPASYVHMPGGYMQLKSIETDSLLLQVTPHLVAATDLRFNIQITYRMANEARRYSFTLPYIFEVVFTKAWNWHPYRLQDGRLVKV